MVTTNGKSMQRRPCQPREVRPNGRLIGFFLLAAFFPLFRGWGRCGDCGRKPASRCGQGRGMAGACAQDARTDFRRHAARTEEARAMLAPDDYARPPTARLPATIQQGWPAGLTLSGFHPDTLPQRVQPWLNAYKASPAAGRGVKRSRRSAGGTTQRRGQRLMPKRPKAARASHRPRSQWTRSRCALLVRRRGGRGAAAM